MPRVNAASQQTLLLSQSSPSYSMCLKGNLDPSTPLMLLLDHGMNIVNFLDLCTPMLKCLDLRTTLLKCLDQSIPPLLFRLDLVLPVYIV